RGRQIPQLDVAQHRHQPCSLGSLAGGGELATLLRRTDEERADDIAGGLPVTRKRAVLDLACTIIEPAPGRLGNGDCLVTVISVAAGLDLGDDLVPLRLGVLLTLEE